MPPKRFRCPTCRAWEGEVHEWFCTRERCPFCKGQLASCGCISWVLDLDAEEQRAVDEYVDDSVEPLRGIVGRWKAALTREGRIPYGYE